MFETFDPKQPYCVANRIKLYPADEEIMIKLYQPLVGAVAISLYQTLIQDYDPYAILSDSKGLYALQEQLDCSLKKLFAALHKLEAVGLVQTFLVDNVVNKVIVFRLLKVPSSQSFFSTQLLASLLKEKIGAVAFHSVSHYFAKKSRLEQKQIKNGQDISASFLEVFHLPGDEAINPSQDVQDAARENQVQVFGQAEVNDHDNVDWDFMKQQFEMYQINPDEVEKNKFQIRALMQSYGLNELEFVQESMQTLHGQNTLDIKKITNLLAENDHAVKTRQSVQKEVAKNKTLTLPTDLPKDKRELWLDANRLSIAEFLYKEKTKKGGFSNSAEKKILNDLHARIGIPVDVVNILTYVCLKDHPNVYLNNASAIANDWLQHGVATSAQALQYLERRDQKQRERFNKRPVYRKNKRVEQGTDWSKKKAKIDKNIDLEALKESFKNMDNNDDKK